MKWSKRKEMNPKEKTRKVCQSQMPLLFYFCKKNLIVCNQLTLATVDGRQNSLILASSCLNFLFQRQRIKSVQTVQAWQINSYIEKQRCSTAKSQPLEEIRADLDRISVKRKEHSKGLLVQVHPSKKKKKCQVSRLGRQF